MHTFFMVLLWGVLALLGLLVILLLAPVQVALEYSAEAFSAQLRILGVFSFKLYPPREEKPKKRGRRAGRKKKEPEEKPLAPKAPEDRFRLTVDKMPGILSAAGGVVRRVLRALTVFDIRLVWPVHEDDAAATAIAYGKTQAWLGGVLGALQNFLRLRFKQVQVLADFTGDITGGPYFSCKIGASPLIMIVAAIYALIALKDEGVL